MAAFLSVLASRSQLSFSSEFSGHLFIMFFLNSASSSFVFSFLTLGLVTRFWPNRFLRPPALKASAKLVAPCFSSLTIKTAVFRSSGFILGSRALGDYSISFTGMLLVDLARFRQMGLLRGGLISTSSFAGDVLKASSGMTSGWILISSSGH